MKKYESPILEEDEIDLTDICAESGVNVVFPGDTNSDYGW